MIVGAAAAQIVKGRMERQDPLVDAGPRRRTRLRPRQSPKAARTPGSA
jgi:hypothetical protein